MTVKHRGPGYTLASVILLSVVGLDDCGASDVLNAYLDIVDKGGCVNILKAWLSK